MSYPKYKKGGAVAKEIKEACSYGNYSNTFEVVIKKETDDCNKIM